MSLFKSIASLVDIDSKDSIADDNSAVSNVDNNPFLSAVVLSTRNAYDTMYNAVKWVLAGKQISLNKLNEWVSNWLDSLDKLQQMYINILNSISDVSKNINDVFTMDMLNEAWEIIQDTPILRRYMGEANYWYMHDTLGLLAKQSSSISADAFASIKEIIKTTISTLLAMTDGVLQLETNLAYISQQYGYLYLKTIKIPLIDSITPNVTTAYYYKSDTPDNPVPGVGFTPIPIPTPSLDVITQYGFPTTLDINDPSTWYVPNTTIPWYTSQSMSKLYQAYKYWGSSYRDHTPLGVEALYKIRDYDGEHPLQLGKTLQQLDTDLYSMSSKSVSNSLINIFKDWQSNYENARNLIYQWVSSRGYATLDDLVQSADYSIYENIIYNRLDSLQNSNDILVSNELHTYLENLNNSWISIVTNYYGSTDSDAWSITADYILGQISEENTIQITFTSPNYMIGMSYAAEIIPDGMIINDIGKLCGYVSRELSNPCVCLPRIYQRIEDVFFNISKSPRYGTLYFKDLIKYDSQTRNLGVISKYTPIVKYDSSWTNYNDAELVIAISNADAVGTIDTITNSDIWQPESDTYSGNLFFPDGIISSRIPTTFASTLIERETKTTQLADVVGYTISAGRKSMFPAFGIYGEYLGMYSWNYITILTNEFNSMYTQIDDTDLYYDNNNPQNVVYRHSIFDVSGVSHTIYHKPITSYTRQFNLESHTFYIYPTISVSVQSAPNLRFKVYTKLDDMEYRYIPIRNAIPKCAKYVNAKEWSVMDILHELYLLAINLGELCGDNGKRLEKLESVISELGLDSPKFIGQLPVNNGEISRFTLSIFNDYAEKIKKAIDGIYNLRDEIQNITDRW